MEAIVAKIARIPEKTVSTDDKASLKNLSDNLKRVVFGQDDPIDKLVTAIKMSRAGLTSPEKPIGSFLFAGPTGVGKTEICKQLASTMGIELIRFDQGGLLTEAVTKHPHSVVLLDEIEKANPEIYNLLLQVMDHGTLTDNNGRKADFRNVIFIMTTNAGAVAMDKRSIGFTSQDNSTDGMEVIKREFTPEFRNRLDAIVQFKPLPVEVVHTVVDKFLIELQSQLDEKKITLNVSKEVRDFLVEHGYDKTMGARPMARIIQEHVKKPLAEMVLFSELADRGGQINISLEDGKVVVKQEDTELV